MICKDDRPSAATGTGTGLRGDVGLRVRVGGVDRHRCFEMGKKKEKGSFEVDFLCLSAAVTLTNHIYIYYDLYPVIFNNNYLNKQTRILIK